MIKPLGLKRKDVLNSDAGRELALLSDLELLSRLATSKYSSSAELMKYFWPSYNGAHINALRTWIIRALLLENPGPAPWPETTLPPET